MKENREPPRVLCSFISRCETSRCLQVVVHRPGADGVAVDEGGSIELYKALCVDAATDITVVSERAPQAEVELIECAGVVLFEDVAPVQTGLGQLCIEARFGSTIRFQAQVERLVKTAVAGAEVQLDFDRQGVLAIGPFFSVGCGLAVDEFDDTTALGDFELERHGRVVVEPEHIGCKVALGKGQDVIGREAGRCVVAVDRHGGLNAGVEVFEITAAPVATGWLIASEGDG